METQRARRDNLGRTEHLAQTVRFARSLQLRQGGAAEDGQTDQSNNREPRSKPYAHGRWIPCINTKPFLDRRKIKM